MPTAFEAKKAKILEQLAIPDADYTDLSPKGSVDVGVRDLVRDVNRLNGFVTTSSCAGRVAVYLEGLSKKKNDVEEEKREQALEGIASGGKGGGQWLYVSHDPVPIPASGQEDSVAMMLGLPEIHTDQHTEVVTGVRFIHLKFEPLVSGGLIVLYILLLHYMKPPSTCESYTYDRIPTRILPRSSTSSTPPSLKPKKPSPQLSRPASAKAASPPSQPTTKSS